MSKVVTTFLLLFVCISHATTTFNGKISLDQKCNTHPNLMVFVGKKEFQNQFLYQFPAVADGEFSFRLLPGNYWIEAISKTGCYGKLFFEATPDSNIENIALTLKVKNSEK